MSALERPLADTSTAADRVAALFRCHGRMVEGICRGMLRDREEAADAAQQTFLSAQRALLTGTVPREPAAWLATIARNECRMRIRGRMTAPETAVLDERLDVQGDATYRGAVQAAAVEALRDVLDDLPERQREALLLREVRGLSYEEVADAMEASPPAVETLIFRARKRVVERIRVVPGVVVAWAKESLIRLGGPADVATAGVAAAKGGAALVAALTATSAAVEVRDRAAVPAAAAPIVQRVDNSGPGSANAGQGRGRGRGRGGDDVRVESSGGSESSGKGRGRGRGRGGSDSGPGSSSGSGSGDDSSSGSGSGSRSGSDSGSDSDSD